MTEAVLELSSDAKISGFLEYVRSGFEAVRAEYLALDVPILPIHRGWGAPFLDRLKQFPETGWAPYWQVGTDEPNHSWMTYTLLDEGWSPPEAPRNVPRTLELLSHPACYYGGISRFRPLSVLGEHGHPNLDSEHLVVHLGLEVEPGKAFLCVGGRFYEEANGNVFCFDGTIPHFAVNASTRDRAVLYLEFDRTKL